jgi:hypothetical protein
MAANTFFRSSLTDDISSQIRKAGEMAGDVIERVLVSGARTAREVTAVADRTRTARPQHCTESVQHVPCCPPEQPCPPMCILEIHRRAHAGEIVLVPFRIRNTTGTVRRYHVGLRRLENEHGQPAPTQPTLDKLVVDINPNQSILLEMRLDLTHSGYAPGQSFEAMIVVREKKYNQNICFRLDIDPRRSADVPVAEPCDEKLFDRRFVSWHHHYYCDKNTRISVAGQ